MRKQEEQNQDQKLLNFLPNLLQLLKGVEPQRLIEVTTFFQGAFLELTSHELFDEETYREEWLDNITVVQTFSEAFKGYTIHEIEVAIKTAQLILETKKEKEATNA